jgi:hypothetical protein
MINYGVILFHTTSSAIHAEKLLVKGGYSVKLIPTPREFSSDCGIALRFNWAQQEQISSVLDTARVEIDTIHQMQS